MDNATQGWIAGLVAAAVTLAFTAWWETKQHRRRQLDDAVTALANANQELANALILMAATGWEPLRIPQLTNPVAAWQLRVRSLAGRRVVGIPSRVAAPARDGLGRSVTTRSRAFGDAMIAVGNESAAVAENREDTLANLARLTPLIRASNAEVAICNAWLNNPWRFFPCRDRSEWAESEEGRTNGGFT